MTWSRQEVGVEEGRSVAHAGSTMRLDFPVEDAATVIGCLALGTLYAIREGDLPQNAGEALAWPDFRDSLRGRIPPAMMRALNGMDEIDLGSEYPFEKRMVYVESLMSRVSRAIPAASAYRLAWDDDSDPPTDIAGESASSRGRTYYEPVDRLSVLRRVGSAYRADKRRHQGADVWITMGRILSVLMTADPTEVREQLSQLAAEGLVETLEAEQAWRPTPKGLETLEVASP